jgi:lipopolysaccharide biosynthesis glycosyltransferase
MSNNKGKIMPTCCITYTTDSGYMFPTLVSAIQARRFSSTEKADVIIFCLGMKSEIRAVFAPICETENIGLHPIEADSIEGANAMLSRLFMNRFVPESYKQYLYMDGDIQILGCLDPLIDAEVPYGRFLAANDPLTFQLEDSLAQSRDLRMHLSSIGLTGDQARCYFNSGVLRINREGWDSIGEAAWDVFRQTIRSRFPDQDALNIVAAERRMPMSLAWNFPIFMRNSRVESEIAPHIYHYMSSPKPWQGYFPPWTTESSKPYLEIISKYPGLAAFNLPMSWIQKYRYHMQQHGKRAIETLTWGFSQRRRRILSYEDVCVV